MHTIVNIIPNAFYLIADLRNPAKGYRIKTGVVFDLLF